jgi:DNA-binding response OmpR family regulator
VDAGQRPADADAPEPTLGESRRDAGQVLIVSPDDRWLRVLDVTLRLGGFRTLARRSIVEANRMRAGDEPAVAIVLDLGVDSSATDLDSVRNLLGEHSVPAVVILPERLGEQRESFAAIGATVLVRPYRPSELYAALPTGARTPPSSTPPEGPSQGEPGAAGPDTPAS